MWEDGVGFEWRERIEGMIHDLPSRRALPSPPPTTTRPATVVTQGNRSLKETDRMLRQPRSGNCPHPRKGPGHEDRCRARKWPDGCFWASQPSRSYIVREAARLNRETAMGKITCDDCGTVNDDVLGDCELCGASLREEKERREERIQKLLAPVAWTGLAVLIAGFLFVSFLWSSARYQDGLHDRTTGLDVFEVLQGSGGLLVGLAVAGAVVFVGLAMYTSGRDD